MNEGLVIARYENCELEVLRNCHINGEYKFQYITRKKEHEEITNTDELYATLKVGAVRLEAVLAAAGALSLDTTIIGNYRSDRVTYKQDELEGSCEGATHVIGSAQIGAFTLAAGASHKGGGHGEAMIAGAGINHSSTQRVLREDGVMANCEATQGQADAPPSGCGAIVRLELAPLQSVSIQPHSKVQPRNRLIVAGSSVLGLGLLVGGGLLAGGLALGSDVQRRIGATLDDERLDLIERGNRANAMAYAGATVMGGSLLVGGILLIIGKRQQDRFRVSPWSSGRSTTGLTLELLF